MGEAARVKGTNCAARWYCGPTCSGKFWSLYDNYGGGDAEISPFWGDSPPPFAGMNPQ